MNFIASMKLEVCSAARSCLRRLKTALSAAALVCAPVASAAAEDAAGAATGGGGKSWAIPWLIVFLTLALGIFITLRPSGRETEVKRDPRMEL
jgi:hypothetical protein